MPRHLGGTNDPENLVKVTIEEHSEIHRCLWVYGNRWQDYVAWKTLSGQIGREEATKLAQKLAMASEEVRQKMRKPKTNTEKMGRWERTPEIRKALSDYCKYIRPTNKKFLASSRMTGKIPWNKNLTKETDDRIAKLQTKATASRLNKKRGPYKRKINDTRS